MNDSTGGRGVRPFDHDVARTGGYLYADGQRLSSRLANARMSEAVLAAARFQGADVIDVGCGDGTYTLELACVGRPAKVHGVDPAAEAIAVATARTAGIANITFAEGDASDLPHADRAFDIALLRGVLHHAEHPSEALREALRVASAAVVVEPNGLNPGLKLLERVSRYHVEHGERSFAPSRLDAWVEALAARVVRRQWVGFVPMFAPDPYARLAKRIEPVLERLPAIRTLACGQYVFTAISDSEELDAQL